MAEEWKTEVGITMFVKVLLYMHTLSLLVWYHQTLHLIRGFMRAAFEQSNAQENVFEFDKAPFTLKKNK